MIIPALTILFPKASINKRLILWQLKGFYLDELEKLALEYYVACIKPNFIVPVISEMLAKQTDGYRIIIVSGGYDLYLKCFIRDFGVKDLIATNIKIENGICSGGFDGKDCLWENKIEMLKIYCEKHDIQIDVEHSYAYSDSKTDLPLLSYVANPVVVRRSDRPQNISLNNQREIVWEN